ncbi:TetR/AcrR family transcriptional regulator [Actinoplanes regularis]|uniref:Transcriptional regulator, TetR family n=1 Tax=Actinoplanes regularis TaxID=52697 RepID=A0A239JPL2_9ACTN|nr:TetR/AcrR family transcriptional regulator [Actinoplanes regularis]GIE92194.1 TetR family transcriptional regulator [Actinoplanes regularis]GLW35579.1 TetR family transcriptional regulator [Actinoplanes regularis]SNT07699.1 transcriptional regulator, TetR family [Actinoplanes regularis]
MPYRQTALTRKNAEDKRESLLRAARSLVAVDGFKAATVAAIAARCQASVGSVYSHFDGRDRLLAEVFRSAASHEIEVLAAAVTEAGQQAAHRLDALIRTLSGRALQGRRLAWALLYEPVSPAVEVERLVYRRSYTELGERIIHDGLAGGDFVPQDARLAASAIVGAISGALVGWIHPDSPEPSPETQTGAIEGIRMFCLRALGSPTLSTGGLR